MRCEAAFGDDILEVKPFAVLRSTNSCHRARSVGPEITISWTILRINRTILRINRTILRMEGRGMSSSSDLVATPSDGRRPPQLPQARDHSIT
jgi:hypothetical protein